MSTKPRQVPAGQFKNTCLALLDNVAATGEEVIVTKRGRPIAKVGPVAAPRAMAGSVLRWEVEEGPAIPPEVWNMTR